jgi:hypothetical protein
MHMWRVGLALDIAIQFPHVVSSYLMCCREHSVCTTAKSNMEIQGNKAHAKLSKIQTQPSHDKLYKGLKFRSTTGLYVSCLSPKGT